MWLISALLLSSFVTGVAATLAFRRLALRFGIVNHPNPIIPQHVRATPYLGGVAVAVAVAVMVCAARLAGLLPALTKGAIIAFAVPAGLFTLLGLADDLKAFRAAPKFLLQAIAASVAVGLGNRHALTGHAIIDALSSWLWILTLVNAFNFTDVCDGLVGSLSLVMLAALALLMAPAAPLCWIVAGATLGFLVFNRPPASIFLGDAGSHFLGFVVASITLVGTGSDWPRALQSLAILCVPLFEIEFITVVRLAKGIPWWRGSPDHFALRLQVAGLTKGQTDGVAAAIALAAALAAVGIGRHLPALMALTVLLIASGCAAGRLLLRWEVVPK